MGKRFVPILCGLLLALLIAHSADAHANLVKSDPPAGALLQAAPKQVVLEFSEELDPSFSRVQLYNSKNQVVNPGPGVIDPATPTVMRLALGDLPKDSYTALWRSRSAADGHITEGSVPFGIGVAATTTSLIPAPGAPDPATEAPPPLDAATPCKDAGAGAGAGVGAGVLGGWKKALACSNAATSSRESVRRMVAPLGSRETLGGRTANRSSRCS
jgi:methionine-rich copper-binding protein CopC